jgi:hypothetical protein
MTFGLLGALLLAATCPARLAADARARYEQADSRGALTAASSVEACSDGEPAELAEVLRWRAQAHLVEGNSSEALAALTLLATIDPRYPLDPWLSPKLHKLYKDACDRAATSAAPFARLRRAPLDGTKVRVEVFDPRRVVKNVLVLFQVDGRLTEVSATLSAGVGSPARWEAHVPLGAAQAVRALVLDDERTVAGTAVATLAELTEPALAPRPVPPPPPGTNAPTKVALVVSAVVIVAAGVTVAVVVASRPRIQGSLGNLELP